MKNPMRQFSIDPIFLDVTKESGGNQVAEVIHNGVPVASLKISVGRGANKASIFLALAKIKNGEGHDLKPMQLLQL